MAKIWITCVQCQKRVEVVNVGRNRYCSKECNNRWRYNKEQDKHMIQSPTTVNSPTHVNKKVKTYPRKRTFTFLANGLGKVNKYLEKVNVG